MSTTITSRFTVGTVRVEIQLNRAALPQPAHPNGYVSFTGTIDGSSGQIVDTLREYAHEHAALGRVCAAWDRYHLKDDSPALDDVVLALGELDGQRLDPPDVAKFEEAEFSNGDDTIDSRDVIRRIEYLTDYTNEHPDDETAAVELRVLTALEDEASGYADDWPYGVTLIRDSYFEDYARELAKDIGAVNRDASWPSMHIDWEAAADALKQDYTSVKFDDVTYWVR